MLIFIRYKVPASFQGQLNAVSLKIAVSCESAEFCKILELVLVMYLTDICCM